MVRMIGAPEGSRTGLLLLLLLLACSSGTEPSSERTREAGEPVDSSPPPLRDVTAEVGLDWAHRNGMSGELYFNEMMGSGAALFDYDNDGDLDLYLVQGHPLAPVGSDASPPPSDRLYRNDLEIGSDGARRLRFVDVTEASGITATGYGMGVAAGDYDNDGWVDLYVTNYGTNQLLHNEGAAGSGSVTFRDVTAESGTQDRRWSVPALFFDYDGDGWLDLYVGNYVDFTLATHKACTSDLGLPNYCGPLAYKPQRDSLFRNRGDGSFVDRSARSGITNEYGGTLGAAAADFDGDGRLDLYVANDGLPNQLWINVGDGTFRNDAPLAGCAVNEDGAPEASMGVAVADFDHDGDEDLFLTHLSGETNTLFVNDGRGLFEDRSNETGVAVASVEMTGFGTGWLDLDNDGWLDLLVVNGAVRILPELALAGDPFPLHQRNQLLRSSPGARFVEMAIRSDDPFAVSEVSRGAAFGDLDNDGDTDVVVTNNSGPARVLVNVVGQDRSWIGLRLVGRQGVRDMLGARVAVHRPQGRTLWARAAADGSYASASDPRVRVGLGSEAPSDGMVERVDVVWPDGVRETFTGVPVGRYTTLRLGEGVAESGS